MRSIDLRRRGLRTGQRASIRAVSRAARFAARLARRHGRTVGPIRRPDLLWVRRPHRELSVVCRQGDRITKLVSFTTQFMLHQSPALIREPGTSTKATGELVRTRSIQTLPTERIVSRRVRVERERIERASDPLGRTKELAPTPTSDSPLPAAVHRSAAPLSTVPRASAAVTVPAAAVDAGAPRAEARALRPLDGKRTALPLPDHEVERIADRVIGSLDRRIVAQRERLGRN
jgi:hypothetical protein